MSKDDGAPWGTRNEEDHDKAETLSPPLEDLHMSDMVNGDDPTPLATMSPETSLQNISGSGYHSRWSQDVDNRPASSPTTSYKHAGPNQDYFALPPLLTGPVPAWKSASNPTSTQTSSNSLHGFLDHDQQRRSPVLRRAPSNLSSPDTFRGRRISHSKSPSTSILSPHSPREDHPVYPDQSFASLQSPFRTGLASPILRTRSSNPSPNMLYLERSNSPRQKVRPSSHLAPRTAGSTPISSPGLFSLPATRPGTSERSGHDRSRPGSPLLHPAHTQKPKVTHTAEIDRDMFTGNKYINDYEILGEIGRGEHGKVKLGRRMGEETNVAVKIVPRYSKKRRLGKLGAPEDDTKREIAVLKKALHTHVVSLFEVIDDPNKNKVYLVLEYVEHGEIKWRKKAPHEVVTINNMRFMKQKHGEIVSLDVTDAEERAISQARRRHDQLQERMRLAGLKPGPKWSLEHNADPDEEFDYSDLSSTISHQLSHSLNPSRTNSQESYMFAAGNDLAGSMHGSHSNEGLPMRKHSIAGSTASHMSSEFNFVDENFSYVPALTFEECRRAFRDTVLGLDFLHFIGIIHRDIKPMNLLVASNGTVKISDFSVSYLGRPLSDEDEARDGNMGEDDAEELDDEKELAKLVGTPAFWAPELCYDVLDPAQVAIFERDGIPKVGKPLDSWSLGITLYCMVYARLPFYEGDGLSLYEAICTAEPFLPKIRLVPVDTTNQGLVSSSSIPVNSKKRLDYDLKFEYVPSSLRDLIRKLLVKDPFGRLKLSDAKKHPWVLEGIQDPSQWIKNTAPEEKKKKVILAVDEKEMSHAVVKRSIVERALSGVTRLAGNILGRRDGRHRARSTMHSPSTSSESVYSPSASSGSTVGKTEKSSEGRRTSLRGDEVVAAALKASRDGPEHPLAQSQTASPDEREMDHYFSDLSTIKSASTGAMSALDQDRRPRAPDRAVSSISAAESVKTIRAPQHQQRLSLLDGSCEHETSHLLEGATTSLGAIFSGASRKFANMRSRDRRSGKGGRSGSASRKSSDGDAHANPTLAVSTASATGDFEAPDALRDIVGLSEMQISRLSPLNVGAEHRSPAVVAPASSDAAFEQAQELNRRRRIQERQLEEERAVSRPGSQPAAGECPPSPDDVTFLKKLNTTGHETLPQNIPTLPSASTIASSMDDFGDSSVSQSISNPSFGIASGGSSPPTDYIPLDKSARQGRVDYGEPAFMRTAETVTAHGRPVSAPGKPLEEQQDYEDGDDEDDDSDEECVMMLGGPRRG